MWDQCRDNGLPRVEDLQSVEDVLQSLLLGRIGLQGQDDPRQRRPQRLTPPRMETGVVVRKAVATKARYRGTMDDVASTRGCIGVSLCVAEQGIVGDEPGPQRILGLCEQDRFVTICRGCVLTRPADGMRRSTCNPANPVAFKTVN